MTIRKLIIVLLCTILATTLLGIDALPKPLVKKLKNATVFITSGAGSGSGFLFRKEDKTGYIATNAHVVGQEKTVKVTFNSGEAGEFSIWDGTVVAHDPKLDLAIVKISSSKLPVPLSILADENKLKTKMPLYALGFPLGYFFSDAPGKNPSVTITQGTLKDLLKNDNGILSDIHFNADINFGNSGGPVVNKEGQVIAVAYGGVANTQVELGIPAPRLYEFIQGSINDVFIKVKEEQNTVLLEAEVSVNDPFDKINTLKLLVIPKDRLSGKLIKSVPETGYYSPIAKDYETYKVLKRNDEKFEGEVSLKIPTGKDVICCYQLMIIKKDKQIVFTEPEEYYIMSVLAKGSKASSTSYSAIQRTSIAAGMKIHQLLYKFGNSEMALGRNNKYLFLLRDGVVYKVSTSSLTVEKVYSTTYRCKNIAISKYGLLVTAWDEQKKKKGIMVLDEDNLSLRAWIPVPTQQPLHIIANPRLRYAYAIEHYGHKVFIVDSKSWEIAEKIKPEKDFKVDNFSTVTISPDGKYFYCKASKALYKFKIYGPKLILIYKSPAVLPEGGNIVVSPDGKYIAFSGSRAIIFQTDDLSKELITLPVEARGTNQGFAFDSKRKRFYYGTRIYTSDGAFIKKIPGLGISAEVLFDNNNRLFLKNMSNLLCIDLDFTPGQSKKVKNNDSDDEGDWLRNKGKGKFTVSKKSTETRYLAKAKKQIEDITITEIALKVENIADKLCWTRDGKSFLVAEKNGIVRKISFPGLVEEYKVDLKSKIKGLQLCRSGAVVLAPDEQLIYLLNEKDLSIIKKIPAPEIWNFSASPSLDIIYAVNSNDKKLYLISVDRGGIIKSLKGLKETGMKSKRLDSYNVFYFDNCHVSNDGKYLLCEDDVPPEIARFRICNKGFDLKYEEEQNKLLDPSSFFNFSMESDLVTEYPKSYPEGTEPTIKAFNLNKLSSLIMKTDVLLLGMDTKMHKFYGLDKNMNLKVFNAQGKLIKVYPTNLQHDLQHYNYSGQILVHPDGAKFIALTRGKIFMVELPEFPDNMPVKIIRKPSKTTPVREKKLEPTIPKAVFSNKKISCVTGSSEGVTRSYLRLKEGYAKIINCVWEPGTNNIFIAWDKGKISKIDVEKMIEICTLTLPLKNDKIGNIAISKAGLIVNLKYSKKVLVFSPRDLSFTERLKFDCNRVLALPNLDLMIMHKGSDLLIYDFNKKEIVGKCPGVDPISGIVTLSPDGKKIYIKDNNSLTIYSLTDKGFKLIKKLKLPTVFNSAKKITISNDGKYLTLLPQARSQAQHPNAAYIYSPDNFKKPVASINTGSPIYTIGFDTTAGLWYYHAPDKYKYKLMVKRGKDIYESVPMGFFKRIYIHPEGGKFLLQDNNDIYWVKIDLSHKNFIKKDN